MKRQGFTLIELLAVIIILAITSLIVTPLILGIFDKVKIKVFNNQIEVIEDAANIYLMGNVKNEILKIGQTVSIELQDLYDKGILNKVKNPYTGDFFDENSIIYATRVSDSKINYYFENAIDCRYNGKKCLVDKVNKDLIDKSQNYQGGLYYKGTNDEITNNYVWYSGQEYRIMGINSDGSIKMITSLPVVGISWGPSNTAANYENSYVRKWLNILPDDNPLKDEYEGVFYKSLNRPDFIVEQDFCIGKQDPTSNIDTTCSTKIKDKVGLLSWREYKISGPNSTGTNGYLDVIDYLALLTGDARDEHNILIINSNGSIYNDDSVTFASYDLGDRNSSISVRPVINLKENISIASGDGTKENPYRLLGDEKGEKGEYLNSRNAGEYLRFADKRYRIVSKDEVGNTKIVMDEYATSTGTSEGSIYTYFDLGEDATNTCIEVTPYTYCNNRFDINDGSGDYNVYLGHNVGYFLNSNASNSFYTSLSEYQEYLDYGTYYLGKWRVGRDYNVIYKDAYTNGYGIEKFKVGMLMYGEMLAGNNTNSDTENKTTYLISPYDGNAFITRVSTMGYVHLYYSGFPWFVVRPVLNLKDNVKIISGDGTLNNPYEITL